jgi:hypothetical protein
VRTACTLLHNQCVEKSKFAYIFKNLQFVISFCEGFIQSSILSYSS